jgi:hypothetical protein
MSSLALGRTPAGERAIAAARRDRRFPLDRWLGPDTFEALSEVLVASGDARC